MLDFKIKENYNFYDLVDIVKCLRAPDGCPWDREQTHKSIRKNFIEETYEACEAIDNNDTALLKEELGDILLQVVLHAQMEAETGVFNIDDVANDICQKLVIRHPHIFSDTKVKNTEEVLDNWDKIKMQTKNQTSITQSMDSICKALPALMYAEKVQKKAAKVGFDFESVQGAFDKIHEETKELKCAIDNNDEQNTFDELGDLLFSVVNTGRFLHIDSEEALSKATARFVDRFSAMEALALKKGLELKNLTLSELDSLWEEVKINLS